MIQEIKDKAELFYFAPDGLMKLYPDDNREAIQPYELDTIWSDNGILFACQYYYLLDRKNALNSDDITQFVRAMLRTQDLDTPGVFWRNPGRKGTPEKPEKQARDNVIATCAGSVLCGIDLHFIINTLGMKLGYIYPNCFVQIKDIAFIKLLAGYAPTYVQYAALILGILINAFSNSSSGVLVHWVKIQALKKERPKINYSWMSDLMYASIMIWEMRQNDSKMYSMFREYYKDPDHPNPELAMSLRGENA